MPLMAKNTTCEFEEVYKDGQIQNGTILLATNKLRYEYYNDKLFTIIYNKQWNIIDNIHHREIPNATDQNIKILNKIKTYFQEYPNTPNKIVESEYELIFNQKINQEFLNDITIKSHRLNMKIYFHDCKFDLINDYFFSVKPFFKLK